MQLLDVLTIYHGSDARTIELHCGDLTSMTPEEAVDLLMISTFPNDYLPISGTSVGTLYRKGVTVEELAKTKAVDMRQSCSFWLSEELIAPPAGIQFKRILCFEPPMFGNAYQVVGDLFRCLAPILGTGRPASVALPLISTRSQNETSGEVLAAIVDAAARWMALGLPLQQIKIVEQSTARVAELRRVFEQLKTTLPANLPARDHADQYDVYLSYAPGDSAAQAQLIVEQLRAQRPNLRIMQERPSLNAQSAWQQPIYETLDRSRAVIALYSPAYLRSKVCQEEFNLALYRHHSTPDGLLFPIFVHGTQLPAYMEAGFDWRAADADQLRAACARFLADLDDRR